MDSPRAPKQLTANQKRALRLGAVVLGIGLGYLCPLLPAEKQVICHIAAKILSLLTGAS